MRRISGLILHRPCSWPHWRPARYGADEGSREDEGESRWRLGAAFGYGQRSRIRSSSPTMSLFMSTSTSPGSVNAGSSTTAIWAFTFADNASR